MVFYNYNQSQLTALTDDDVMNIEEALAEDVTAPAVTSNDDNTELEDYIFDAFDASKIYGPKGIGLLFVRRGVSLAPQILGGGQEDGRRSGTEHLSHIVGFSKALLIVQNDREKESKRLK